MASPDPTKPSLAPVPAAGPAWGAAPRRRAADRMNLAAYWRVIRRHLWGIIGLALVGAIVGVFKGLSAVPIYQARLTMQIEWSQPRVVATQDIIAPASPYLFYETQYDIIRSRAIAARVVEKLRLDERRDLLGPPQPSPTEALLKMIGLGGAAPDAPEAGVLVDSGAKAEAQTGDAETAAEFRRQGLIGMVQGGLSVSGGQRSQIVSISFDSPSPELAAEIANAAADAYMELGMESRLDTTQRATSWLTDKLEELRRKVAESEAELQAFQAREGLVDTESLKELTSGRLQGLNAELVRAQTHYSDLAKRYGQKHPRLIAAKAELEEARRRLREEQTSVVQSRGDEFELAKLEREVATNRELYNTFLTRFKETDISTDSSSLSNVRVIDRAQVPNAPYKPNRRRMAMMWLLLGLAAGVGLAFLREYVDNTFKGTSDVEEKLKLPVLGVVPLLKKSGKNAQGPERHFIKETRSTFAEAINHVRTGVLFSRVDDPPRTVLVTSAVQSEGKTTLASNLALAFSQLGPTLLIDADLRKPRVASVAGLDRRQGLVEVVAGQQALKDCVVRDEEAQNLYILKSGTIPPNPLEILSSEKFAKLLAELKKRFEHIVIDTAPVLPVSDAVVVARVTDAVIMVLQAGKTTQGAAIEAVKRLRTANVVPIGVVLSQVGGRRSPSYYGDSYYYGGYGYGYGYGYGEKEGKAKA
jgi:capsular exopolysaccharide synthesis family protein